MERRCFRNIYIYNFGFNSISFIFMNSLLLSHFLLTRVTNVDQSSMQSCFLNIARVAAVKMN